MYAIRNYRNAFCGTLILAAGALIVLYSHAAPVPANPTPRAADTTWQDLHFVFGKIVEATRSIENDKGSITYNVTFHIKVSFDNTSALTEKEITITGPEFGMNASLFGWNMPDLTIGDYSTFYLDKAKDGIGVVAHPGASGVRLPIGIATGYRVAPGDVEQVREALALISKYLSVKDFKKNHDDAALLFKSKDYYFWALGAYLLGQEGAGNNDSMRAYIVSDDCTADRFLWLMEQLPDQRPEQQIAMYRQYMQKHSQHLLEPAGG